MFCHTFAHTRWSNVIICFCIYFRLYSNHIFISNKSTPPQATTNEPFSALFHYWCHICSVPTNETVDLCIFLCFNSQWCSVILRFYILQVSLSSVSNEANLHLSSPIIQLNFNPFLFYPELSI